MKYKAESLEQALYLYGNILHSSSVRGEDGNFYTYRVILFKSRFFFEECCNGKVVSVKRLSEMKRKINQEKRESKGYF